MMVGREVFPEHGTDVFVIAGVRGLETLPGREVVAQGIALLMAEIRAGEVGHVGEITGASEYLEMRSQLFLEYLYDWFSQSAGVDQAAHQGMDAGLLGGVADILQVLAVVQAGLP